MERDSEVELVARLGQFADFFGQADSRDSDAPRTQAQTIFGGESIESREKVFEVGERFTHSHHDDVGQFFISREKAVEAQNLFENFARGEVTLEAQKAAGTEDAAHAAADLSADADGAAIVFTHEDAFDERAVVELQEQFFRAVFGDLMSDDFAGEERKTGCQEFAQFGGEVGHLAKLCGSIGEDLLLNLAGPVGGQALFLAPLDEFGGRFFVDARQHGTVDLRQKRRGGRTEIKEPSRERVSLRNGKSLLRV